MKPRQVGEMRASPHRTFRSMVGIQDLRTRKVSNRLTIPFFFAGLISLIMV
jgi:Flp pilus assembly protein protease CpaA